ncbi:hypothetical protein ACFPCZ_25740, partial [Streptomonospora arabica]
MAARLSAVRLGRLLPWAAGAGAGVLALGPALGPGFVLSYDMVAVPDPPLSAVTLGGGGGFPRAVPSDAVFGALGLLLPGDAVQALLLMAVFTVAGAGAGRLVPAGRAGPRGEAAARVAAAVFYAWNPFVAERLLLGQWAMLLGYAGLPWVAAAAGRLAGAARPPGPGDVARLLPALLPAAVGGFSAMVLSALVGLPAAVLGGMGAGRRRTAAPRRGARHRLRAALGAVAGSGARAARPGAPTADPPAPARHGAGRIHGAGSASAPSAAEGHGGDGAVRALRAGGAVAAAIVLLSLPWLVPALGSGARTDPGAVGLFAARADTPFGAAGSLLSLGGVWNAHAVPEWFGAPGQAACRLTLSLAAVAGWVWLLRRGGAPGFGAGLSAAAAAGLALALAGTTAPGRDALAWLIGLWAGFGPLRDGQLYVAPLALLQAAGIGGAVLWACRAAAGPPGRAEARRDGSGAGAVGAGAAGPGGSAGGHDSAGAPGGPPDSSQADRTGAAPSRLRRLWTAPGRLRRAAAQPAAHGRGAASARPARSAG